MFRNTAYTATVAAALFSGVAVALLLSHGKKAQPQRITRKDEEDIELLNDGTDNFSVRQRVAAFFRTLLRGKASPATAELPESKGDGNAVRELFGSEVENRFQCACETVERSSLLTCIDNKGKLKLYGLYKQATEGDCDRYPKTLTREALTKWKNWRNNVGMTEYDAKKNYAAAVDELCSAAGIHESSNFPNEMRSSKFSIGMKAIQVEALEEIDAETDEYFEAIRDNDVERVTQMLQENASLANAADSYGTSGMHLAADSGFLDIIEVLLSNGSKIDNGDSSGDTALYSAVIAEKPDAIKLLLKHGANPHILNHEGVTPFTEAQSACKEVKLIFHSQEP